MAWVADIDARRTFDPATGREIVSVKSFSDGLTAFRIDGPGGVLSFTASKSEAPITEFELEQL